MTGDFEELFQGICVIIDDEVEKPNSPANDLYLDLKEKGIPILTYKTIPYESIEAFQNVSYLILDWGFKKDLDLPDGVDLGEEETTESLNTILDFLKNIKDKFFVPIFLLTGQNYEDVKKTLINENIYAEAEPNRIMLESKNAITDYESLKEKVQEWLSSMPSAMVLKIWEKEAVKAKHKMFLDLYQASPEWVKILLKCIKEDTKNNEKATNQEFQGLLNNNFINRINDGNYFNVESGDIGKINPETIRRVLEGERFIPYGEDKPDISYVGDLYKSNDKEEYFLNIRAQCDLSRIENPCLYLIKGKALSKRISYEDKLIRLIPGNDKKGISGLTVYQKEYLLDNIMEFNDDQIASLNAEWDEIEKGIQFSYGELIPKRTEAFVACLADQKVIHFKFSSFHTKKKEEIEKTATRIGRLIPPYITKIQQECSAYFIRTGIMPLPAELFHQE